MGLGVCALVRKYAPQIARCTGDKPLADVPVARVAMKLSLLASDARSSALTKTSATCRPKYKFPTLLGLFFCPFLKSDRI
jgi:hypothetical protein